MQSNISLSALTTTTPAHVLQARAVQAGGSVVITMPGAPKPLYSALPTMKPRTVHALTQHALERLAPFGIPDLAKWNIEVCELDNDVYQVDFVNSKGARLTVDSIWLTSNKCGVEGDYGFSASVS